MPSLDALNDARLAGNLPAQADVSYLNSGSGVDTSSVSGIQSASATANVPASGKDIPAGSPGAAWTWNGTNWVRPNKPSGATPYTWDDAKGWVTTGDVTAKSTEQLLADAKKQTDQVNAIANLTSIFAAYGLSGDFANSIKDMVIKGYTADTISLIAQDPNSTEPIAIAFQTRFAGNASRIKAGLAPLSPAEYIATERSYRQVMSAAGLPKGFYDDQSDFTKFITQDVSPTELKTRVDLAAKAVTNSDPFYRQALQQQYGLSTGDMIAHVLDPTAALPLLQKQAAAVELGAEAQRQGLAINNATAELYGAGNISQAQAAQGFKTIAGMLPTQQRLAAIYSPAQSSDQGAALLSDVFTGPNAALAEANIKKLQAQEVNAFSGSAGAGKGSLGADQTGVL